MFRRSDREGRGKGGEDGGLEKRSRVVTLFRERGSEKMDSSSGGGRGRHGGESTKELKHNLNLSSMVPSNGRESSLHLLEYNVSGPKLNSRPNLLLW